MTNIKTLKSVLAEIAKLDKNALNFIEHARATATDAMLYVMSDEATGNSEPLSKMRLALLNIGHKALAGKFQTWVADASPYILDAATHSVFKKRRKLAFELDLTVFEQPFDKYQRETKTTEPWTLERAIKVALQRQIKEAKMTEAEARALASNYVANAALKIIKVSKTAGRNIIDNPTVVDIEANQKEAA